MTPPTTVALVSLGCPKNLVDSQAMLGLLAQAGYEIVEETEAAEVVIVNTCAFIEPAQEEAIDALLDLADLKQSKCRALICAGCLAQRHGEALLEELPEVDAFIGVGAVPRIVDVVRAALAGQRVVLEPPLTYLYDGTTPRYHTGPEWLAYVKIADGCDHRCAFCTIPGLRGRYRSVAPAAVRAQVEEAARAGVREVCLVAQDTSAYGRDLEPRRHLAELLDQLARIQYDGWLRLLYLHPDNLDDETIARLCAGPPLVPYFDIPLQHAARSVLRSMGRRGDPESYLSLLTRIRADEPDAAIRTTFIVGYPGETQEDFEALLEFVAQARFDRLSCFRYWPEPGTHAAELPEQVPFEVGDERLEELLRVQEDISLSNNRRFVGRRLRALVEQPLRGRTLWAGRTYRDAPEVDAQVKIRCAAGDSRVDAGRFVEIEVTGAEVHDVVGRVAEDGGAGEGGQGR